MKREIARFFSDEDAAITVDFVIITGLIVAAVIAALAVIAPGANKASNDSREGIGTGFMAAAKSGSQGGQNQTIYLSEVFDDEIITPREYEAILATYDGELPSLDAFYTDYPEGASMGDFAEFLGMPADSANSDFAYLGL